MNEETAAAFQREGNPAFNASESTADETAADSQSEVENKDGDTQSAEGEKKNTQTEDNVPFHEHPRWKAREEEWNKRFNDQETRHGEELKTAIESIRSEFGSARKDNAGHTKIPSWFGGNQEQWDAYRSDRDTELKSAQEAAIKSVTEQMKASEGAEDKAVKDATDYFNSEVTAIETDTTLNPTGAKVDREKLLKTVLDNDLIDSKGRWNYRAGFKLIAGAPTTAAPKPKTDEKKKVAAATTSEGGGERKEPTFATSDTFKKKRPW